MSCDISGKRFRVSTTSRWSSKRWRSRSTWESAVDPVKP